MLARLGRHGFCIVALVVLALAVGGCASAPADTAATAGTSPATVLQGKVATDAAALAREANIVDYVSVSLRMHFAQVESIAAAVDGALVGSAGQAFRTATAGYRDAAARQSQQLDEIAQKISQAGIQLSEVEQPKLGGSERYNFGEIVVAADAIQASAESIDRLLDEGKGSLARLSAIWGDSESAAYMAIVQRWDVNAGRLRDSLGGMLRALHTPDMRP
jgi:uncharacterized protein YukE